MHDKARPAARSVRSYVLRQGRLTKAQRRALAELLPRYGIEIGTGPLDLDALFGRRAPRLAEIGFGNGESLAALARAHPERDFIGIEVHRPGIGHLLLELERSGLGNVRVVAHDALDVLERALPPASLDGLQVFFPDPWPKKRHRKRRLVQGGFFGLAARAMRPGALLELATDSEDYAAQMLAAGEACPYFDNAARGYAQGPRSRRPSRFQQRGERLGHCVRDLMFRRNERAI